MKWKLARRTLPIGGRTLVMAILNVTPDSFSDGGRFFDIQAAVARAEEVIAEGADILDVGGESTRPGAASVSVAEEIRRVVPVIEAVAHKIAIPVSVDTTKAEVAHAALQSGADIINDISGLRFDPRLADEAARAGAGLILMHSRGTSETMHKLEPVADVLTDVISSLHGSIAEAERRGVALASIALDPGIGFSKSAGQNVELLAKLNRLASEFAEFPILVGTSRKRFIGALLGDAPAAERIHGTMATVTAAVLNGASIVRVHDVRAAVETVRVADAVKAVTGDG